MIALYNVPTRILAQLLLLTRPPPAWEPPFEIWYYVQEFLRPGTPSWPDSGASDEDGAAAVHQRIDAVEERLREAVGGEERRQDHVRSGESPSGDL